MHAKAALQARESGLKKICIIERDIELGGILNQCIHNGFGLQYFKEELTGPEYAGRFIQMVNETDIEIALETIVLQFEDHRVHTMSPNGYRILDTKTIILAMGCRERTRGAIKLPGTRPSGILTAGSAQRLVNIQGYSVGRRVVILGSGDIGMIMARRMTLEGAKVLACVELMPYSSGLNRNIVQCLHDYDIPLFFSHTITDIRGLKRLEGVTVSRVDDCLRPVPGSEMDFACDTLLLSVGLIPENELSQNAGIELDSRTHGAVVSDNMETSQPGVFACGNALHVHDLADFVTLESQKAGAAAAQTVLQGSKTYTHTIHVQNGDGVVYALPHKIRIPMDSPKIELFFRVYRVFRNGLVTVSSEDRILSETKRGPMVPGEMQHMTITQKMLGNTLAQQLTVSVREAEL
ncbi:MAG: FAD-dependent oxidoreductase [Eubacteriales bacterium]